MIQVKIFTATSATQLETKTNEWLKEHPTITFVQPPSYIAFNSGDRDICSIAIWYKETPHKTKLRDATDQELSYMLGDETPTQYEHTL